MTRRWEHTTAISHLFVVSTCEGRYKCIVATAGDPPMIRYSSYLTFMCCVNMWGKIQVYCGNSGWPADDNIHQLSHISFMCCVNMLGKIQVYCGNNGDPPMIRYSSYLTFMCCVNMWGKIQVYCGNSGWPADDNIQQLSHIYVLCQHVREDTSVLWQQRWPADDKIQQLSHIYVLCQHLRDDTSFLW